MSNQSTLAPWSERLLYLSEVLGIVPFGRTKLLELVDGGEFPKPKKIGTRNVWKGWEIKAWQES